MENGTLRVDGQSYTTGLGLNAQCTLVYDLPAGHQWTTFRALCGYDSSCDTDNPSSTGTTMEFVFYVAKQQPYTFDLTQLGYSADEAVPVYDVWAKESCGTATGTLTTTVPSHGVKLFRLGDEVPTGIQAPSGSVSGLGQRASSSACFDLQGRKTGRLNQAQPGLYIKEGRKIAVRR